MQVVMDTPAGLAADEAPEVQPFLTEGDAEDPFAYHCAARQRGERRETHDYFRAGRRSHDPDSPDFKRRAHHGRRSNSVESNVSLGEVDFSRPAVEAAIKDEKRAQL